jgi:hypothetical protein
MAPPPAHGENGERVNIRINDPALANAIHKAAVTRDYIKQPRLSKISTIKTSILILFVCLSFSI